jgi:hypothetical protein
MGGLLTQYNGTGQVSLDNYISMISGYSPTPDTDDDCLPGLSGTVGNYNDVVQTGKAASGQVVATGGCIYAPGCSHAAGSAHGSILLRHLARLPTTAPIQPGDSWLAPLPPHWMR